MDVDIARAQAGDEAAMERVLASVTPAVQRFGMRMCRNDADADDVLQDTLLTIATRLPQYQGRSSFSSWVFAVVRSACARRRRGLSARPHEGDEMLANQPHDGASPEERAADRELGEALSRALDRLSSEQREIILLRDVDGLSAVEAADALGTSVDAVKSRLHRARASLEAALARWSKK
jgi:RNA polymerase sigma-70 factor (ECF subfamily)